METSQEQVFTVEGSAPFLDVVYETIEAHIQRTGEEYEQVITGVKGADVGDVGHESSAVLYVYVLGSVDPEEAQEWIDLALDRIADDHDMDLAREGVHVTPEIGTEEKAEEEI